MVESRKIGLEIGALYRLSPRQQEAAEELGRDVIVTAGAGSGKTRTLVAHYVSALAHGATPRSAVAITFTEKAAREMRSRVRSAVMDLVISTEHASQKARWTDIEAGLDAARIGTIHSLCAEILRTHPAVAEIDPHFRVLEEGMVQALKAQIVIDSVAWAADTADVVHIFNVFSTRRLAEVLHEALAKRLEVLPALVTAPSFSADLFLSNQLMEFFQSDLVQTALEELRTLQARGHLRDDAGERLAAQVERLVARVNAIKQVLGDGDTFTAVESTYQLRREDLKRGTGRKDSRAKRCLDDLQAAYDTWLNPWIGGKNSHDEPPSEAVEQAYQNVYPSLLKVIEHAFQSYREELDARSALDFDDLEQGAVNLLQKERIRKDWQARIDALMVDEFQDTNQRQRQIVEALNGGRGVLFVVGDARQSIYRFRGAEVGVFREMQEAMRARGGKVVALNESYRAHNALSRSYDFFLQRIMSPESSALEAYDIPFQALRAVRSEPRSAIEVPLEMITGWGESADEGRSHAARQLALRLLELLRSGVLQSWEDVALLFRSSTAFEVYEIALEEAGIPFVTVAGRGFYHRPEVRDVLNALRYLASPWDELALSGWLRSPCVGLRDDTLMKLTMSEGGILEGVAAGAPGLSEQETARLQSFRNRVSYLRSLADRVPVSVLLEELYNQFDVRAVMAGSRGRMLRNLEKLVHDAQTSGLIRTGEFLQYIQTLRDVGVREGEAPVEARGSVQLMTIHKAKGLEFPVVVLADASHQQRRRRSALYTGYRQGLAVRPDRMEEPLVYRFTRHEDAKREVAEEKRLLYVAATRAQELLIISGHATRRRGRLSVSGWLGDICACFDLCVEDVVREEQPSACIDGGEGIHVRIMGTIREPNPVPAGTRDRVEWPESDRAPLYSPLFAEDGEDREEDTLLPQEGRGLEDRYALRLGYLTHAVLQEGVQLSRADQKEALHHHAFRYPFKNDEERDLAIEEALLLLDQLRGADIWGSLLGADERHHEIPFVAPTPSGTRHAGQVDLLYRKGGHWFVLDFKTDSIESVEELERHVRQHRVQLDRYAHVLEPYLDERPAMQLCFLNVMGTVRVVDLGMGRRPMS